MDLLKWIDPLRRCADLPMNVPMERGALILAPMSDSDARVPGTAVTLRALRARVFTEYTTALGMPTSARYVVTTVNAFGALVGGTAPEDAGGSDVIVAVVIGGRFGTQRMGRPRGSPGMSPESTVMYVQIDAATGRTRGWGLRDTAIALSALGHVETVV